MGIRKIEDEMGLREAMKKKAAELKIKEIKSKASIENLTKVRVAELAKKHGVILALNPKLKEEVRLLQEQYNIPSSKIITEQIHESDVLKKSNKIDHEKLGLLAYQRVLMRKEEIGAGRLPISEVFEMVNTGMLNGIIGIVDILKAMKILHKTSVIENVEKLDSGIEMVHFFPIEFTTDQTSIIGLAKEKGYTTVEDICLNLEWSQDRALKGLKSLEDSGIAKFRESIVTGKQWFFPSI